MKTNQTIIISFAILFFLGCGKVLDLQPTDKLQAGQIFGDPQGVKIYMANLYSQLPIEDFLFFRNGFNINSGDPNNGGFSQAMVTDEAVHSEWGDFLGDGDYQWWEPAYKLNRDVNLLIDAIPTLSLNDNDKKALIGETAFIKAYIYFALAKRYGGVPLIKSTQQYSGDASGLREPRSTEKETWDYVMDLCDTAVNNLGESNGRRASKWIAYALKSRAALFAASIAKYGNRASMSGTAVTNKLVGVEPSVANEYYQQCIDASIAIINSGKYSLFRPNPATPEAAAENYRLIFQDPNSTVGTEAIFIKGYAMPGNFLGHNYDIWYGPAQTANGWPHPGRMNPSLDLIDIYESYNNPGQPAPIKTRTDSDALDYNGYNSSKQYIRYDNAYSPFVGKDARLWATAILPNTIWKNTPIIIQAGYIKPDGTPVIRVKDQITVNGATYYTYGALNTSQYSGFDTYGGNNTRTGFAFRKFMNQNAPVVPGWNQSTTDFIEFRYAEILLNYAEAVVESDLGDKSIATTLLNSTRKRAAHTNDIDLTIENVQRERRVELAFENKRFWDLIRRREFHTEFNNRYMHALLPLQDLRTLPDVKYIFVRTNVQNTDAKTFQLRSYYRAIPGIGSNNLIQNPEY